MKSLLIILIAVAMLLLIPLIAMQFTTEVNWSVSDFFTLGLLLLATGLLCGYAWRKIRSTRYRIIVCGAILLACFLTWAELAVGIFGKHLAGP